MAMRNPARVITFHEAIILFRNEHCLCEKTNFFVTIFSTIRLEKAAGPAEPILSTSPLLRGTLPDDAGEAG